ncbi:MAG TPA: NAD(P)/FAD-dependent oxidoreductase [Microlunatus sp.]
MTESPKTLDVVVIGGGSAGLSGALALTRSRRRVLVVDSGEPRNAPSAHVHNYLTRDGAPPAEIYSRGREEVLGYGGRFESGRVTGLARDGDTFRVQLAGGSVPARRLLVATGSRDELPDIPGLAERWGIDVLHCPYCHGWEVRDQRIGVLASSPMALHQVLMFRQLTADVSLLPISGFVPSEEQLEQLAALSVPIREREVVQVELGAQGLTGVRLADRSLVPLDALVVAPRCFARAELLGPLGLEAGDVRVGEVLVGTQVEADPTGATAVPGVWVAGNVANAMAHVATSSAAGVAAGAAINADLIAEDTGRAVQAYRDAADPSAGGVSEPSSMMAR